MYAVTQKKPIKVDDLRSRKNVIRVGITYIEIGSRCINTHNWHAYQQIGLQISNFSAKVWQPRSYNLDTKFR